MVNGAERELYINQMLRIGNFVGLDANSLLIGLIVLIFQVLKLQI